MFIKARVELIEGVIKVNLPTYSVVDSQKMELGAVVIVDVPDEYGAGGNLDEAKIRHMYRGQSNIDNPGLGERLRKARG